MFAQFITKFEWVLCSHGNAIVLWFDFFRTSRVENRFTSLLEIKSVIESQKEINEKYFGVILIFLQKGFFGCISKLSFPLYFEKLKFFWFKKRKHEKNQLCTQKTKDLKMQICENIHQTVENNYNYLKHCNQNKA